MKIKKPLYIILAVIILSVCLLATSAFADAGNFSGGSDYGGSSWGGSSDWGGSSGGNIFILGGSGGGGGFSIIAIIVIFVILFVIFKLRKNASFKTSVGSRPTGNMNLSPLSSLLDKDPNFSEAAIREKVSNLYVRMQNAWQDKDFSPMRPFMTDALYSQFVRQLNEFVSSGCTNFVERIAVLDVSVDGWTEDDINDSLIVTLNTRITDYTVNDSTGKVVSGSRSAEKFMCYQWTLIRSKGMTTPEPGGEDSRGSVRMTCPSCGAPLEINQSAECEYCGTIINLMDHDWVISNIRGISQRTSG